MLFWTVVTSACTNPYFKPAFKVAIDTINSDIQNIVKTQDISIEGHKTPLDDKVITSLSIQLINAQDINVSTDSLVKIQRKVAKKVKGRLKDSLQYDEYWMIFIKRDSLSEGGYFPNKIKATEL
ncbi:MAG: hypothetical protein EOO43_07110 [Flavobacterium sp.]|nr:MAG: hypothetical protein EOO43_07110 [Flavobacterium sp.]